MPHVPNNLLLLLLLLPLLDRLWKERNNRRGGS